MDARRTTLILALVLCLSIEPHAQTAKHPITLDDINRLRDVRDPQLSPDGQWVAYVVSSIDVKEDKSHIWMASYDGKIQKQMTSSADSESSPPWSPDGQYLSFTSSRPGPAKGEQVGCSTQVTSAIGSNDI